MLQTKDDKLTVLQPTKLVNRDLALNDTNMNGEVIRTPETLSEKT